MGADLEHDIKVRRAGMLHCSPFNAWLCRDLDCQGPVIFGWIKFPSVGAATSRSGLRSKLSRSQGARLIPRAKGPIQLMLKRRGVIRHTYCNNGYVTLDPRAALTGFSRYFGFSEFFHRCFSLASFEVKPSEVRLIRTSACRFRAMLITLRAFFCSSRSYEADRKRFITLNSPDADRLHASSRKAVVGPPVSGPPATLTRGP